MLNAFLKCYTHDSYRNSLMFYYCHARLSNILPSEYSIHNTSHITTPYYESVIQLTRTVLHLPRFPLLAKDKVYDNMLTKDKSSAELLYPTFNWENIWKNYINIFILSYDKEIMYKHLHMCLATNKRLYTMNLISSSNCNKCRSNREETPIHMFYQCDYVKPLFLWVLRCLSSLSNFEPSSNIRFIYFDNVYSCTRQKNICNIFIYLYVITIWRTRKENLRIGDLKHMILSKFSDYRNFLKHLPSQKYQKLSEELQTLDIDNLLDL